MCSRRFLNRPGLLIHMKYFHRNQKQAKISNKLDGNNQLKKKNEAESKTCKLCNKVFCNKHYLKKHIENVHEKTKICLICNKCFLASNIVVHLNSAHKKLKLHKCHTCNKTFSRKVILVNHEKQVHFKI